jgi:hypothetical protein
MLGPAPAVHEEISKLHLRRQTARGRVWLMFDEDTLGAGLSNKQPPIPIRRATVELSLLIANGVPLPPCR